MLWILCQLNSDPHPTPNPRILLRKWPPMKNSVYWRKPIEKAWWHCSNIPKWPLLHKIIPLKSFPIPLLLYDTVHMKVNWQIQIMHFKSFLLVWVYTYQMASVPKPESVNSCCSSINLELDFHIRSGIHYTKAASDSHLTLAQVKAEILCSRVGSPAC